MLYELVSSRRPFGGPSSISIVHDVLRAAPPRPEALGLHPRLWEIIERGWPRTLKGASLPWRRWAARWPSGRSRPGSPTT